MTMTDPIADMLTRLRNANSAYHDTVGMPHSTIKVHIAEILQQEGYIAGWQVRRRRGRQEPGGHAQVRADPGALDRRASSGCPSPGCACTRKKDNLPRVLGGLGVAIISTSGGLMTDKQANKRGVGGEVLAYVW